MKNILIIINFILIIFIQNSFSQNSVCVPEAQRGYDKVDKLLEKAKSYGDKGNYNSEKKFAEKAVDLTLRIRKDYHCFSPRAFWKLSDANCHLGDFQSALKDAIKAYQECVDFKFDNCNFFKI